MFQINPGYYLIFASPVVMHSELSTLLNKDDFCYDLVSHIDSVVSRMRVKPPDAILIIERTHQSVAFVKNIRKQEMFDRIPIIEFPNLEIAIFNIRSWIPHIR